MIKEELKIAVYKEVHKILNKEVTLSNIGVHKELKKFVEHLSHIMSPQRIINQIVLACDKYKEENGTETMYHKENIVNFINENYA